MDRAAPLATFDRGREAPAVEGRAIDANERGKRETAPTPTPACIAGLSPLRKPSSPPMASISSCGPTPWLNFESAPTAPGPTRDLGAARQSAVLLDGAGGAVVVSLEKFLRTVLAGQCGASNAKDGWRTTP